MEDCRLGVIHCGERGKESDCCRAGETIEFGVRLWFVLTWVSLKMPR